MNVSPFWVYLGLAGLVVSGASIVFGIVLFVHAMREDHRAKEWRERNQGAYDMSPWSRSE